MKHFKSILLSTLVLRDISDLIKNIDMTNIIYFPKINTFIAFESLTLNHTNGTVTIDASTTHSELDALDSSNLNISSLEIRGYQTNEVLTFNSLDCISLGSIRYNCYPDLAREYYRLLIAETLYSNESLFDLARTNPLIKDGGVDLIEMVCPTSNGIPDDMISSIRKEIAKNQYIENMHLQLVNNIKDIVKQYPNSLFGIENHKFNVVITIYDDIRAIRFNEMEALKNHETYATIEDIHRGFRYS